MSKFLNTTYKDTVEGISGFYENLVDNPFYILNDKKPVFVTYYNINKLKSSVDPGSKLQYDNIGYDTPMRFNRIYDFALYGLDRIELSNEIGEFGLEANTIEGDAYILPNTIVPYEGDYFEISHIKDSTWLFIVKDVQKDTLDNGANAYKISYKLEYDDNSKILKNIVGNYRLIEKKEGTNTVTIIDCEDLNLATLMDKYCSKLKTYYIDLFYRSSVQTFIHDNLTELNAYDPYLIEFLIRHDILSDGKDEYIYVDHKLPLPRTFKIEYDKVFLHAFEIKDHEHIRTYKTRTGLTPIKNYGSIFSSRYEMFLTSDYFNLPMGLTNCIHVCLEDELVNAIEEHTILEDTPECTCDNIWQNILVKYFYDEPLTEDEIKNIDYMDFKDSITMFYIIPLMIFCLESYIENVLK